MDGDELTRPMKTDAVKKYFVKKWKLDKSQILKGDLGVSVDWKPERAV